MLNIKKEWKYLTVCLTVIIIYVERAVAQEIPHNLASWIGYEMYLPFKENGKWGMLLEGYSKANKGLSELQGAFYRIGANYYTKKGNRWGFGYAYQWNIPYDEASLPYDNPDYRIYEQFIWRIVRKNGDLVWTQRFRMEQRWLGRKNGPDYDEEGFDYYKFENTFRYQIRYQRWYYPRWAFVAYDELHIRTTALGDDEHLIDQNRLYLGAAYALNARREMRMELGYMNQTFFKSPETESGRSRVNHTIRLTFTTDLPFSRQ